jgi:hypothetical protein
MFVHSSSRVITARSGVQVGSLSREFAGHASGACA